MVVVIGQGSVLIAPYVWMRLLLRRVVVVVIGQSSVLMAVVHGDWVSQTIVNRYNSKRKLANRGKNGQSQDGIPVGR